MKVKPFRSLALLLPLCLIAACSPVYVAKSAAGHGGLLWRRRSIAKAVSDPKIPAGLREKLLVVLEAREFAFDRMNLRRSKDFSTYSPIDRPYVTWLVSAAEKTRFKPVVWRFPLIGSFPYKGHFEKQDALSEKKRLEDRGYDVHVGGVSAYKTPLPFSDPLPSPVLDEPPGRVAELIIHELTHGTVFFKSRIGFDEALATFVGNRGAEDFLAGRYGAESKELSEFHSSLEREKAFTKAIDELYGELDALYKSAATEGQKLERRAQIFRRGEERFKGLGFALGEPLNNAVLLAHRLYHEDLGLFEAAYEQNGRDWPKTIALFKSLDPQDPAGDLRRRTQGADGQ